MSSEALERTPEQHTLEELHPAAYRCWKRLHAKLPPSDPRDHDDPSVNLDTLAAILHATLADRDTLLAEIARLEQERDEARHGRELARLDTENERRLLAVAREREQRLREALEAISWMNDHDAVYHAANRARAALVDGPAAAGAAVPGRYQDGTDGEDSASAAADAMEKRATVLDAYGESLPDGVTTEAFAEASNLRREARRLRASAAADEPGETP